MSEFRIVSFLPAATEMIAALELDGSLVGISHECDWPPEIRHLPRVVESAIDSKRMGQKEIDDAVREHVESGKLLYTVDVEKLKALNPTHIITQDLCEVCAPSGESLKSIISAWDKVPQLVSLTSRTLTDIAQNLRDLGDMFGHHNHAEALLIDWKARMDEVQERAATHSRVRCFIMEWVDPIYCSGHWVAEMLQVAGGYDLLARPGQDSRIVSWEEVCASAPEVLIISPCGYNLDQASDQLDLLKGLPGWNELPAVQSKRVYAVNANAFLTRPGPRVVDGIEMLAYLLHS